MNQKIRYGLMAGALLLPLSGCGIMGSSDQSDHINQLNQTSKDKSHDDKSKGSQQGKTKQDDPKKSDDQRNQNNNDPEKSGQTDKNNQESSDTTTKDGITVVKNPTDQMVLVNKTHKLPDGYIPPDLTIPDVPFPYEGTYEKMHLRKVAASALENLFHAAQKDGIILYAQSGYRSFTRQTVVFEANVKSQGEKKASAVSAHPGTSEHQTGLAMDISSADIGYQLIQDFGETEEGKWVKDHCAEYGFIIRYPQGKDKITGYEYEPWHLRYVGKEAATYIQSHQITLEKYIANQ